MTLGNKGFMLSRLVHLGFRVPSGFILTTEIVRHPDGLADPSGIPPAVVAGIGRQVARLERATGRRLGDPANPLLLSVRGGAPVSMPGMLESILDVGITEAIAEGMARIPRHEWAAWDSYRRFLQFWGMSHGVGRDLFDELLSEAKQRHGVPKKRLLEPEFTRDVARHYRTLLEDHRLQPPEDPFAQLLACVEQVRRSWHSEHAHLYRRALHIAEEWETAVIVQVMVFGNLDAESGTGVLLTRHPHHASGAREPYGDFVVQGQGDDVVAGLVETHPITESQRRAGGGDAISLELGFPAVYAELAAMSHTLVRRAGDEPPGDRVHLRGPAARGPLHPADPRHGRLLGLPRAGLRARPGPGGRPPRDRRRRRRGGAERSRRPHGPTTSPTCAGGIRTTRSSSCAATRSRTTSR